MKGKGSNPVSHLLVPILINPPPSPADLQQLFRKGKRKTEWCVSCDGALLGSSLSLEDPFPRTGAQGNIKCSGENVQLTEI